MSSIFLLWDESQIWGLLPAEFTETYASRLAMPGVNVRAWGIRCVLIAALLLACVQAWAADPGDRWTEPATGMEFAWVPGGCYQMGLSEAQQSALIQEIGAKDFTKWFTNEIPRHEVCVDGFWMGKQEVTQGQWAKLMGNNPSKFTSFFRNTDDYPVEQVSWNDTLGFIARLNSRGNGKFRLPTEAEWEYAARSGGREETYAGGEEVDEIAWYKDNSKGGTHPVGMKSPNGLGLYDMSGNVWEWCADTYDWYAYSHSSRNNPVYEKETGERVLRGGSWLLSSRGVRSANRGHNTPDKRDYTFGFRLVRIVKD